MDIGRCEGEIVLGGDPYVCPRHARVYRTDGRLLIQDLGSINGVFLRIRERVRLRDGDRILCGLHLLEVCEVPAPGVALEQATERGTQVFGCPLAPRYARLSERAMDGAPGNQYFLSREETILGREVGDIVFSTDPFMSRRHAAISRDPADGSLWLQDIGSSNGTFIRVRGKVELTSGDFLRIGQHLFRIDEESGQAQAR